MSDTGVATDRSQTWLATTSPEGWRGAVGRHPLATSRWPTCCPGRTGCRRPPPTRWWSRVTVADALPGAARPACLIRRHLDHPGVIRTSRSAQQNGPVAGGLALVRRGRRPAGVLCIDPRGTDRDRYGPAFPRRDGSLSGLPHLGLLWVFVVALVVNGLGEEA